MLAPLSQLLSRKRPHGYENAFVEKVTVTRRTRRSRRVEQLLIIGWVLIGIKSVLVVWTIRHWHVPFNPLWVIAPTVAFAALCTAVYLWRD
ncbi:MAG: hypothetical protein KGJ37_01105 [Verrucomicrobiota bacterium]|nr:hypothetical protein [Verrucomicrobiota bacterium]